jgi:hypothetical protein
MCSSWSVTSGGVAHVPARLNEDLLGFAWEQAEDGAPHPVAATVNTGLHIALLECEVRDD